MKLYDVVCFGDPAGKRAEADMEPRSVPTSHKVVTETGQRMVSLARIPHLENSLYLICVDP